MPRLARRLPGLAQFDAACVDPLYARQIGEQRAVAAADVENPRVGLDHVGDQAKIAAQLIGSGGRLCGLRCGDLDRQGSAAAHSALLQNRVTPRCSAQPVRKPRSVANSSGSCSRNASWPLSVSISTKLTLAATALRAWTRARLSEVGNSQSLVNEIRQNRGWLPAKAAGNEPPCSAARSK